MPTLGLTGNIASGKSHIAEIFRKHGALVHNSDLAAHEVMNSNALPLIAAEFPGVVENGKVNRAKLGAIVFNDAEKLIRLEKILHPLVRQKNLEFIAANKGKLLVIEIPLLYETDAHKICDYSIFVNVSRETQQSRARARSGLDPLKLEKIIARQTKIPVEEKIKRADFVIHNSGDMDAEEQVKKILAEIARREKN